VRRRGELAIAAIVLAACSRSSGTTAPAIDAAPIVSSARTPASSAPPSASAADASPETTDADRVAVELAPLPYVESAPRAGRAIGHTSVVFKLELSSGKKAAFKPASRRGPIRYKGEVAAYRLGRALGIPNVPPAYYRTFDANALAGAVGGTDVWPEVLTGGGVVKGAIIPWIDKLELLALEREPLWSEFRAWLRRGAEIPAEQRELARQASTLVVFDWLTGNWDRWSGGNVGIDKKTDTLLFIDNDGAFFENPPKDALAKTKKLLGEIDRYSKSLVETLRTLDDDALRKAIGDEREGVPLLDAKPLAGVFARRAELLRMLDAKIGDAGASEVLFFD
jgi:hypothetical protein